MNLGDARHGGALRPSKSMNPMAHWNRDIKPDFDAVIAGLDTPTTCAAVFDNKVAAEDFVKRIKEEDLGLSINISTSIDGAEQCCHHAGIPRHSVGYSLGFEGNDRKAAEFPGDDAFHHVRARHGEPFAGEKDDRLGEGRPAHAGAGGVLYGAFLLLRCVQSGAGEKDPGGCAYNRAPRVRDRMRNRFLCLLPLLAVSLQAEIKVLKNFTLIDGTGARASRECSHDRR